MVRIYLVNVQTLGAYCGYGQGETREEAIEDALRIARQYDPDAYYNAQAGCVCFAGGINW